MTRSKTISIFAVFLFGFVNLYGQAKNIETLSIEECLQLANEKQQGGNARDASYFLNAAADKSWEAKDYRKAVEYYTRSIKQNETISNFNGIAGIQCNLGLIYFDMGEYENSYENFRKSYLYRKGQNEKYAIISGLINMSVTLNAMKRYDESIKALEEGVSVATELNDYEQMRSCFGMISETYTLAGNPEKAAHYFDFYKTVHNNILAENEKRHKSELTEATLKAQLAEKDKELAETRQRWADYELAEISKAFEGLDSTNRVLVENKTKAELMIENFQNKEKIAELERREIEDRLKIEEAKTRMLIVELVMTLVIVIVIAFFFWQKRRDNRKLAKQNTLIMQAQKELDEYQEKLEESVVARTSALMKLLEQVRESDRLKSAFFSNMSHEIRTPLNAILGFSQVIYNPDISEEEKKAISYHVKLNAEQLMKMFEDIITLSEIDSGIISVHQGKYNVHEILNDSLNVAVETVKLVGKDNVKIILDNEFPKKMKGVLIDGIKIRRILTHLIDNAIKNTESGYVRFGCETILSKEKMLRFWVEDTGTGIDEKDLESIYTRFWKHGDILMQKFRGLGIGLSLCKELLEIMNGKIWLTTEVGRGTTFSFTINYQ